jgi:hypothetical protein
MSDEAEKKLENLKINARLAAGTELLLIGLLDRAALLAVSHCHGPGALVSLTREDFLGMAGDCYDTMLEMADERAEAIVRRVGASLAAESETPK